MMIKIAPRDPLTGILLALFLGFVAIVVGAILASKSINIALAIIAVGLGCISAVLGLISVRLGKDSREIAQTSDERMEAMVNLEFREKMAMVAGYIGDWSYWRAKEPQYRNKRIEQDLKAALELKGWVKDPELKRGFKTSLENFRKVVEQTGETGLSSILQTMLEEIKDW